MGQPHRGHRSVPSGRAKQPRIGKPRAPCPARRLRAGKLQRPDSLPPATTGIPSAPCRRRGKARRAQLLQSRQDLAAARCHLDEGQRRPIGRWVFCPHSPPHFEQERLHAPWSPDGICLTSLPRRRSKSTSTVVICTLQNQDRSPRSSPLRLASATVPGSPHSSVQCGLSPGPRFL